MEEFRVSAVPTLRLPDYLLNETQSRERDKDNRKPPTIRRATEPTSYSPRSPISSSPSIPSIPSIPYRPRNTSPFARGHLRSKSTTSAPAPPMSRTQSMPGFNAAGHLLPSPIQRPSSPFGSPARVRTPKKPVDDVFPGMQNRGLRGISEVGNMAGDSPSNMIAEEHTPRAAERSPSPILGLPPGSAFPRNRRPSSPLRYLAQQS